MSQDLTGEVSRGSQFLSTFNEIEAHVRHSLDAEPGSPFMPLVGKYRAKHGLSDSQYKALKALTALRNSISHGEYFNWRAIAEPVQEVVDEISGLRDYILRPPLAWDHIPRLKPCVTNPHTPIRQVLSLVHEQNFSQVPVYGDAGYEGLLTTNCIARWFAAQLDSDSVDGDEPVDAVMRFAEHQDRALHARQDISASEAVKLLSESDDTGYRPAALIMTRNGAAQEPALAVVVDYDLPRLNRALTSPTRAVPQPESVHVNV